MLKYEIYKQNAHFVEFTSDVVDDLTASAFRRDVTISEDLPLEMEYVDYETMAKEILPLTVAYGRCGVLVDYPTVNDPKLSEDRMNKAFYVVYQPLDIINWDYVRRSGVNTLVRIVLREESEDEDFTWQYRELYLDSETGNYTVRVHYNDGAIVSQPIVPMANGQTLKFIPFTFVGVTSNNLDIDKSPVIGISNTNLKHYQTWAEMAHCQTYIGHPQLVLTGLPSGFNKRAQQDSIKLTLDASNVLALEGEAASASLLEISGTNLMHYQTLALLSEMMAEQGRRVKASMSKTGVESVEAIKVRHAGEISKLGQVVQNVELALKQILEWMAQFMGSELNTDVNINKQFFPPTIDGKTIQQLSSSEMSGTLPRGTTTRYLQELELGGIDPNTDALQLLREGQENDPLLPQIPETDGGS
jgi:hypothetical protein